MGEFSAATQISRRCVSHLNLLGNPLIIPGALFITAASGVFPAAIIRGLQRVIRKLGSHSLAGKLISPKTPLTSRDCRAACLSSFSSDLSHTFALGGFYLPRDILLRKWNSRADIRNLHIARPMLLVGIREKNISGLRLLN